MRTPFLTTRGAAAPALGASRKGQLLRRVGDEARTMREFVSQAPIPQWLTISAANICHRPDAAS